LTAADGHLAATTAAMTAEKGVGWLAKDDQGGQAEQANSEEFFHGVNVTL
jgi:hypothetical protein